MDYKVLNYGPIKSWGDGLKYEASQMPLADELYKKLFKDCTIHRWKYDDPEGKEKQSMDIDVTIETEGKKIDISEKFRTSEYGDMFIELYNGHTEEEGLDIYNSLGWAQRLTLADTIFYYTPHSIHSIDIKTFKLVTAKLTKQLGEELKMLLKHPRMFSDCSLINPEINIVCCPSDYKRYKKTKKWSIGICIPWKILEDMGCKIQIISKF